MAFDRSGLRRQRGGGLAARNELVLLRQIVSRSFTSFHGASSVELRALDWLSFAWEGRRNRGRHWQGHCAQCLDLNRERTSKTWEIILASSWRIDVMTSWCRGQRKRRRLSQPEARRAVRLARMMWASLTWGRPQVRPVGPPLCHFVWQ